jgi:hypothetical protein
VVPRLLEVLLERAAELVAAGGAGHLRKRFEQLLLGAAQIAELLGEDVLDGCELGHGILSVSVFQKVTRRAFPLRVESNAHVAI